MSKEQPPQPDFASDPLNKHESRESEVVPARVRALQKYLSQIGVPVHDRINMAGEWLKEHAEEFENDAENTRALFEAYIQNENAQPEDFMSIIEGKKP